MEGGGNSSLRPTEACKPGFLVRGLRAWESACPDPLPAPFREPTAEPCSPRVGGRVTVHTAGTLPFVGSLHTDPRAMHMCEPGVCARTVHVCEPGLCVVLL